MQRTVLFRILHLLLIDLFLHPSYAFVYVSNHSFYNQLRRQSRSLNLLLNSRSLDTAEEEKAQSGYQGKISPKNKISQIVHVVPKEYLNSRYVN